MPLAIVGITSEQSEPLSTSGRDLLEGCDIVIHWTAEPPDYFADLQPGTVVVDGARLDRTRRVDLALTYSQAGHDVVYLLDAGLDLEGLDEFVALLEAVRAAQMPDRTLL